MSVRTLSLSLALAALAITGAAAATPEAQVPGSDAPKAVAEARHNAKVHGIDMAAKQPAAQAAGSPSAQAKAEAEHLAKSHGRINDAADRYTLATALKL
ncbi:MAG: hypothetical protein Q8R01_14185 [Ramlibacter sp.]|nr:hypothetical protein [Ramlibacter sp.]